MNRRGFIKACLGAAGAAVLAPLVKLGMIPKMTGVVPRLPGQGRILNMGTIKKNYRGGWDIEDWWVDMKGADRGAAGILVDDDRVTVCGYSLDELHRFGMNNSAHIA